MTDTSEPQKPEFSSQPEPESPQAASETSSQSAGMTAGQLDEARDYGRKGLACDLLDRGIDIAYLSVMAFVFACPLEDWLNTCPVLSKIWTLRLAMMFLIVIGLHVAVSFPVSLYSGHILEHRFGLSNQTFGGWLVRYLKRNAIAVVFGLVMFIGLYWVIWLTGQYWWMVAAGAFFAVSILLGQLAPVLIMPLFYKIERLDMPELTDRLARLSEGTGLSIEGVYRMDLSEETSKANAMLAGMGHTRRVLLGDTVISNFSLDEIEVIFAHEIGHHVFHHIRKLILAGLVYSAVWFWVCDLILRAWVSQGGESFDYAQLPIYTLPLVMLTITLLSNVIEPLQNAVSRHYERQCDQYALDRTGLKDAFISAFRKLAKLNKDNPTPPRLEVLLFHSHPPIGDRLAMAEKDSP
ncbi:MAG: M48 family metallopeptidase [Pirellulales bacterium]|nr:M48 family metallopeptidase [Pirellulales bacterium]